MHVKRERYVQVILDDNGSKYTQLDLHKGAPRHYTKEGLSGKDSFMHFKTFFCL